MIVKAKLQAEAQRQQATFEVWAENWDALEAFLAVCDQWDYPPLGGKPFRLNAVTVFKWLELTTPTRVKELWPQIRTIAAGALDEWSANEST